jgi:hypothetical protein
MLTNFREVFTTFKGNLLHAKGKSARQQLLEEMQAAYRDVAANLQSAEAVARKSAESCQASSRALQGLLALEREYAGLLREVTIGLQKFD